MPSPHSLRLLCRRQICLCMPARLSRGVAGIEAPAQAFLDLCESRTLTLLAQHGSDLPLWQGLGLRESIGGVVRVLIRLCCCAKSGAGHACWRSTLLSLHPQCLRSAASSWGRCRLSPRRYPHATRSCKRWWRTGAPQRRVAGLILMHAPCCGSLTVLPQRNVVSVAAGDGRGARFHEGLSCPNS